MERILQFAIAIHAIGETRMKGKLWPKVISWILLSERFSVIIALTILSHMMKGTPVILE